jgi:two-component system nitrogen regulation response regulator NtrX
MAILSQDTVIDPSLIPVDLRINRSSRPQSNLRQAKESAEREYILKALEDADWNVSGAARALGLERTNLHKRMRALGLTRERAEI